MRNQLVKSLLLLLLVTFPVAAGDSAPGVARKAAAVIAAQRNAHPRYSYRMVRADLYVQEQASAEERYETRVYFADEKIERIEYLAGTQRGRTLKAVELKRISDRADEMRKRQAAFRPPYELAALEEYDFRAEGVETVANRRCYRLRFRAHVIDSVHANGLMWVDTRSFNAVKLSYEWAQNPAGVESSQVEVARAPVLADLWAPVRTYQRLDRGERGYEESAFVNSDFREP